MINDNWCLHVFLQDNYWNDSPTRPYCTGIVYYPYMRTEIDAWREVTKFAADNGCNSMVLKLANGVKYESHPEIAVEGAWEVAFLKEELKRLRELGLKVYPNVNFSAGHDAWLGIYGRMVSTPKYYRVVRDLIHEIIDIFDTPEIMVLELDEENAGNQGRLDYACYRQYDLIWHDVNFMLDCVREKGVRPCIDADYYWTHKQEFLDHIERDVLISQWYYGPLYEDAQKPLSRDPWMVARRDSYKELTEAGYDIILHASSNEGTYNFEHQIRYAMEHAKQDKIWGMGITGWWGAPTEQDKYFYMDAIYQAKYTREKFFGGENHAK